jgi:uncharacterized protein (TIGR03000 family)
LPADAKLYVDDQLMKTVSERRTFITPPLEANATYYYILRAEAVRDGKPVSESKRVVLHAGDLVRASFGNFESTSTARAEANPNR